MLYVFKRMTTPAPLPSIRWQLSCLIEAEWGHDVSKRFRFLKVRFTDKYPILSQSHLWTIPRLLWSSQIKHVVPAFRFLSLHRHHRINPVRVFAVDIHTARNILLSSNLFSIHTFQSTPGVYRVQLRPLTTHRQRHLQDRPSWHSRNSVVQWLPPSSPPARSVL